MTRLRFDRIPAACNEVIIASNPTAGSVGTDLAVRSLRAELAGYGFHTVVDSDIARICETASRCHQEGRLRAVVAAGGDGTVALLANRLSGEIPIAILPQGTENLLAKHLETPSDPLVVSLIIREGWWTSLDAGEANGKLFLVMASCGFDAEVVHQLHAERQGNIRHWSYAKPILNSIRRYRYPTISIRCDDQPPIKAKWAFVFNVPRYAMGLPIADHADAMDGRLDLCTFRGGNLLNGVMYLFGIIARQHRRWRDTRIFRARRLRLRAKDRVPYQLDGDPGGFLPLDIRVLPERLRVIVPETWARKRQPTTWQSATA